MNGLATPWGEADLAAVAGSGADAVLLPKVEDAEGVREALRVLEAHGAPESLAVWCMLETPRGILRAEAIAAASPRMAALVMGTSDLTKDLHARHTRDRHPLVTSLGLCVLAARAHGLAALDGVHLDLDDEAGFAAACRQAADFGFDGKTLIHPSQVDIANSAFGPSADEIDQARLVVEAWADAQRAGKGVAVLNGRLVENLHAVEAERVLAFADALSGRR